MGKNNFSIYDGHDLKAIRIFSITATACTERSNGREAVLEFLRTASSEDEFFLVLFNDRPEVAMDFIRSVDHIENRISTVKAEGTTALLDAVYLGLIEMKYAHKQRKVLLIVSDGGDNHSRYRARQVLSVLAESNVQTYALDI